MATKTKLTPEQVKQFAAIRSEIARLKAKNEQLRQRVTAKKAQRSFSAGTNGADLKQVYDSFFSANKKIEAAIGAKTSSTLPDDAQQILDRELPTLLGLSPNLQREAERLQTEIERIKKENPTDGDVGIQLATKRFVEEAIRAHNIRNADLVHVIEEMVSRSKTVHAHTTPDLPTPSTGKGIVGQSWKTPKGEYTIIQSNDDGTFIASIAGSHVQAQVTITDLLKRAPEMTGVQESISWMTEAQKEVYGITKCPPLPDGCGNFVSKDGDGHKPQCPTLVGTQGDHNGNHSHPTDDSTTQPAHESRSDDTNTLADTPPEDVPAVGTKRNTRGTARMGGSNDNRGDARVGSAISDNGNTGDDADALGVGSDAGEILPPTSGESDGEPPRGIRSVAVAETRKPKTGIDFRITDDDLGVAGAKTRYKKNVEAIRLVMRLDDEKRKATAEEQAILAGYSGWGALPSVFEYHQGRWNGFGKKPDWYDEHKELRELMDEWDTKRDDDLSYWETLSATTLNAHYTQPRVIRSMWEAARKFGFKGGSVLEPACGIGNFFGMMPDDLREASSLIGVEIDPVTSRIASQLYQNATIKQSGFEDLKLPDGIADLAISNVPFGDYPISDKRYANGENEVFLRTIHNYFFKAGLDRVREGGIVAFVTSRYTMDGRTPEHQKVRELLAAEADLIGAVRMPNTTFAKSAGTQVTTDTIYLRKREKGAPSSEETQKWLKSVEIKTPTGKVYVNEYYVKHPEMMLGTMEAGAGNNPGEFGMVGDGRELNEALASAVEKLPANVMGQRIRCKYCGAFLPVSDGSPAECNNPKCPGESKVFAPQAPKLAKAGEFFEGEDGKLYRNLALGVEAAKFPRGEKGKEYEKRARALIQLAKPAMKLLEANVKGTDISLATAQANLATAYDEFVKAHGPISSDANRLAFEKDPHYPYLRALEKNYNEETSTAEKSDIFTKRQIGGRTKLDRADSVADALSIALDETGEIDFGRISKLMGGRPIDELQAEMDGTLLMRNPEGGEWELIGEYLAGNVRKKLDVARQAADADPRYQKNVEQLEAVLPADIPPGDIQVSLDPGCWVEAKDVRSFVNDLVGASVGEVRYLAETGSWFVDKPTSSWEKNRLDSSEENTKVWGIETKNKSVTAFDLIRLSLNGKQPRLRKPKIVRGVMQMKEDGTPVMVIDAEATARARAMQEKIKKRFSDWAWEDAERATRIARKYNDQFNSSVEQKWDGSKLTIPGMAQSVELMQHQKDGIYRAVYGKRDAGLFHKVGFGKTFQLIGTAIKGKQVGKWRKPLLEVPNHLVQQMASDTLAMFPSAKVLAIGGESLSAAERKELVSRIATQEYDLVVCSHDVASMISMSGETQGAYIREQLRDLEDMLAEIRAANKQAGGRESKKKTGAQKDIEKRKKKLEAKLKSALASDGKDDDNLTFESLGVDHVLVDEAHLFKNLAFTTTIDGITPPDADRAQDLHMKSWWLRRKNDNNRAMTFATGTPVANSFFEAWTMARYLAPDLLKEMNIQTFNGFMGAFGKTFTTIEMTPDGSGYRERARFKYKNLPEFMKGVFRQFADIRSDATEIGLKRPEYKGGKPQVILAPKSIVHKVFIDDLADRMTAIKAGDVEPDEDNPLVVTGDGRKLALSLTLVKDKLFELEAKKKEKVAFAKDNMDSLKKLTESNKKKGLEGEKGKEDQKRYDEAKKYYDTQNEEYTTFSAALANPKTWDDPNDKIGKTVTNVGRIYKETTGVELPGRIGKHNLTQMIFCDLSAPSSKKAYSVYNHVREKLMKEHGIPKNEIAFIHDYATREEKAQLQNDMRSGKIRVLLGSTQKMGTGLNVQDRMVALHHMDVPWRPDEIEQRSGRIMRQGNFNKEIEEFFCTTEATFDVYMLGTNEAKAKSFGQIMSRHGGGPREMDDVDGEHALTLEEIKAISTGRPEVMEKVKVDNDLRRIDEARRAHITQRTAFRQRIAGLPDELEREERGLARYETAYTNYRGKKHELSDAATQAKTEYEQARATTRDLTADAEKAAKAIKGAKDEKEARAVSEAASARAEAAKERVAELQKVSKDAEARADFSANLHKEFDDPTSFKHESLERKEAGETLTALAKKYSNWGRDTKIELGEINGFAAYMTGGLLSGNTLLYAPKIHIRLGEGVETESDCFPEGDPVGNLVRVTNDIKDIEAAIQASRSKKENLAKQYDNAKREMDKPFDQEVEYERLHARQKELEEILGLNNLNSSQAVEDMDGTGEGDDESE